ncbi:MAG: HAMP domain-containing protein, partial [Acidimicrobiales bacterium]
MAVTTMVTLAFVVPLGLLVRDVARDRALTDSERDASALFPVLAVTDDPGAVALAVSRTRAGAENRLAVILPSGVIVGAALPESPQVNEAILESRAWTGDVTGGAETIVPVVRGDGAVAVVRVFVTDTDLSDGVTTAWLALGLVALALVAVAVVLADRLGRSMTRPVTELARASQRLGQGDLATRVEPDGPPEVMAVGHAFNVLAERIDDLLRAEREDVADLAHRLRTPLTALRLQIDQVTDGAVRDQLGSSADALARSLDRVIEEARRRTRDQGTDLADLADVTRERFAYWRALGDEQGRPAELVLPDDAVPVAVAHADLTATLDVMLENVFTHTPEGTGYRVDLTINGSTATLRIEDNGAGLPDPALLGRGE